MAQQEEIVLWIDRRWKNAIEKHLKDETLQEHLENVLDELCNQLPQREYVRISRAIQLEAAAQRAEEEAARTYAAYHVTENGQEGESIEEQNTDFYDLVEQVHKELHQMIDDHVDALLQSIAAGEFQRATEWEHPLTWSPAGFKGTKAVAVILPDGREVEVHTWREATEAILLDCNADPIRHAQLAALCDCVNGNFRPLLSSNPEKMVVPVMIDDDIYFESKLDTEQLLRVLKEKVLEPVGYDCSAVTIRHRERTQVQEQYGSMTMQM